MHQQQRRGTATAGPLGDHAVDGRLRGVHRGHDPADQPEVLDLQAVDGVALVGDITDPEVVVEVAHDIRQWDAPRLLAVSNAHRARATGTAVP